MRILKATHRNNTDTLYTLTIYDSEAVTSPEIEFKCKPEFFKKKHEGAPGDTFKRIIPTSLSFTVLYGCADYTEEQSDAVADFYHNLTNSYEGRFYCTVTGLSETVFRGKILPDVGDYLVSNIGDFVVTAIDGITDLMGIDYRPAGYTDLTPEFSISTQSFNEHFLDIIQRIDTVQFFKEYLEDLSVAISLLATANNWTESMSAAGDIWEQVKVRNFYFEQISSYRKYRSCWDVLTDLLTGFNARMHYDRGRYYIEQLTLQDNNPMDITYYHYTRYVDTISAGATLTKLQHNYDTDDDLKAGPFITKRVLPAFKAIELKQGKQFTNYIDGVKIILPGNPGLHDFGYTIAAGNVFVSQWHLRFKFDPAIGATTGYPWASQVVMRVEIRISIDEYYLKNNDLDVLGDPTYITLETAPDSKYHVNKDGQLPQLSFSLDTDSTIKLEWKILMVTVSQADFVLQLTNFLSKLEFSDLVFQSDNIPVDGDLKIELISFSVKNQLAGAGPIYTIYDIGESVELINSRLIVASTFNDLYEKPKGIKRYEIGDSKNSIIYPVELNYYDSTFAATNQLFIGTTPTVEWTDPDSMLTLPIEELMMKSMLSMRAIPSNTYLIELFYLTNASSTYIGFGDQVVYNGNVHIIIDMEMTASGPGGYTTYKCTLWEVYKDYSGINILLDTTGDEVTNPVYYPVADGSLPTNSPNKPEGLEYWDEWSAVSTAYVSPNLGEDLSVMANLNPDFVTTIKKKWHFYINGVKQLYTPTGTLALRQWRFDLDNNRIVFFKGSGPVAHIEVYKYY